jgi:hypothetical protein
MISDTLYEAINSIKKYRELSCYTEYQKEIESVLLVMSELKTLLDKKP